MKRFVLFVVFTCILSNVFAEEKPNLVLFPIEVDESDSEMEDDYGASLQQSLQGRYKVFYGPAVEKELEKEYSKFECTAEECSQNVAIAFNGELTADASATKVESGYALKLVIRNIFSGELVESKTDICRGCDSLAVIDRFKILGQADVSSSSNSTTQTNATQTTNQNTIVIETVSDQSNEGSPAIFLFDSNPTGARIKINGEDKGFTPYQGLEHSVGESLKVELLSDGYENFEFETTISSALVRLQQPFQLRKAQAKVLIASDPPVNGAKLIVDDQVFGVLPFSLELDHGSYQISIEYTGNKVDLGPVELQAGLNPAILLDIEELSSREEPWVPKAIINVDVLPKGLAAEVFVKGEGRPVESFGNAPVQLKLVPGKYSLWMESSEVVFGRNEYEFIQGGNPSILLDYKNIIENDISALLNEAEGLRIKPEVRGIYDIISSGRNLEPAMSQWQKNKWMPLLADLKLILSARWTDINSSINPNIKVCHDKTEDMSFWLPSSLKFDDKSKLKFAVTMYSNTGRKYNGEWEGDFLNYNGSVSVGEGFGKTKILSPNIRPREQTVEFSIKGNKLTEGLNTMTFGYRWRDSNMNCAGSCCSYVIRNLEFMGID